MTHPAIGLGLGLGLTGQRSMTIRSWEFCQWPFVFPALAKAVTSRRLKSAHGHGARRL